MFSQRRVLMDFELNKMYTHAEICAEYRGSPNTYLPMIDGNVTCGRFTEEFNPDGPEEILFGNEGDSKAIIEAAKAVFEKGQRGKDIPVFWKHETDKWEYRGRFLCIGMTMDSRLIEKRTKKYPERVRIHGILWFEKVD